MKNPFYPGDKVRYKDGDTIYTVWAIYSDTQVSLGLEDYPDVEQDYKTDINNIEFADKYNEIKRKILDGGPINTSDEKPCVFCGCFKPCLCDGHEPGA